LKHCEILIVGDGIAGLVLSCLLERRGIAHVVLCRKSQKKALSLGETLPPSALPLLQSMDLLDLFESCALHKTYGYESCWAGQFREQNFFYQRDFQYGLKIDKLALLALLKTRGAKSMLEVDGITGVQPGKQGVTVTITADGQTRDIPARLVVDATGRNRFVLKALGFAEESHGDQSAFSCHLPRKQHPDLAHSVFSESFPGAWGMVSGLSEKQQVMTLFCGQDSPHFKGMKQYENWPAILAPTLYLRHFLSEQKAVKISGAQANTSRALPRAGLHCLPVGDAALAFDPLSSHGISNAVYTAKRAAELVELYLKGAEEALLEAYWADLGSIFEGYLREWRGLLHAVHGQFGQMRDPRIQI
jgi:2-polyprenyl-6-methoxyphenol hydroxylase-like FAD-dependent oxidoreductase